MIKSTLCAVALTALLAGPALAHDRYHRDGYRGYRGDHDGYRHDYRRHGHRHHDRHRHYVPRAYYRGYGYRLGYEFSLGYAGGYYGHDYYPGRWARDPYGHWYFEFYYQD